jgi:hypothetical protein
MDCPEAEFNIAIAARARAIKKLREVRSESMVNTGNLSLEGY